MSIRAHSAFYDISKRVFVAVKVHIPGCGVSLVLRNGCNDPRETSSLATQTGLTPTGPTIGAFFPSPFPFRLIIASVIRVQPVGAYLRGGGGQKKGKRVKRQTLEKGWTVISLRTRCAVLQFPSLFDSFVHSLLRSLTLSFTLLNPLLHQPKPQIRFGRL